MKPSKKIAFIFPGQGAQYAGMGKDFYDNFPEAKETFQEADELLSSSFSHLIFEGAASDLLLTKNSQLAIYIVSMAIVRTLKAQMPELVPHVCAGLSLGEYTALTASGKISFAECLPLVKVRSEFMQQACEEAQGTMRVVLGLSGDEVEKALSSFPAVCVANLNCPGQVVIAGEVASMEAAAAHLKEQGAKRVLPLDVSGAFHSPLMESAKEKLSPYLEKAALVSSSIDLVMNVPGGFVKDLADIRRFLTLQVTHPVRWEKGILAMKTQGIDLYIEIGPGKTLSGMNKRIDPLLETLSIEKSAEMQHLIKRMEGELCSC